MGLQSSGGICQNSLRKQFIVGMFSAAKGGLRPVEMPRPIQSDLDDIRAKVQTSGSSFYWAMRLLPRKRREALFAIYAFCREVDDIADGDLPQDRKVTALRDWHKKIDDVFDGHSDDSITRALGPAIVAYDLNKDDFRAVIGGMEMDAVGPIVAPPLETLDRYCDRVASAVGRLCVRAFGEPTPAGECVANHLGRALQLTNILRDVEEDAAIGRLYLPSELLERAGITAPSPDAVIADVRLPVVMEAVGQMAEDAFTKAQAALAECSKNTMRPAVVMMMVYRKHLKRVRANGWHPLPPRTSLGRAKAKLEKFWIAVQYGLF